MKNIKYYFLAIAVGFMFQSCEPDEEGVIFNGAGALPLVEFETTSANLPVLLGSGNATVDILVDVSTVSNQDRTFAVTLDSENSTADPSFYTLPASLTVPAGAYEGVLTVTGNEVSELTTTPTSIVVNIEDTDQVTLGSQTTATVNVFLVCPIPADYLVGDYNLINTVQAIGPRFGDINLGSAPGGVPSAITPVTVTVGSTQGERVFRTKFLPRNSGTQPEQDIVLNLVCGTISLANTPAFRPGSALIYVADTDNETYDLSDDSEIFVSYIENPNDTNGINGRPAEFVLQRR